MVRWRLKTIPHFPYGLDDASGAANECRTSRAIGETQPLTRRRRARSDNSHLQVSASISACMRLLYSSDQRAPGFTWAWLRGCAAGGALPSVEDLRAAPLSLSVTRGGVGLEEVFESFMLFGYQRKWVSLCVCRH